RLGGLLVAAGARFRIGLVLALCLAQLPARVVELGLHRGCLGPRRRGDLELGARLTQLGAQLTVGRALVLEALGQCTAPLALLFELAVGRRQARAEAFELDGGVRSAARRGRGRRLGAWLAARCRGLLVVARYRDDALVLEPRGPGDAPGGQR